MKGVFGRSVSKWFEASRGWMPCSDLMCMRKNFKGEKDISTGSRGDQKVNVTHLKLFS